MKYLILIFFLTISFQSSTIAQEKNQGDLFLSLLEERSSSEIDNTLSDIQRKWKDGFAVMAIETISLSRDPKIVSELVRMLKDQEGLQEAGNFNELFSWLWRSDEKLTSDYASFKAQLYGLVDTKFTDYFEGHQDERTIRFDEIRWGGVSQDGIPPLRDPKMISAKEADYLGEKDVVFGIEVNDDVRAYPKRILAWHEMFVDEVGGEKLAGVYCTLCGTVILFKTEHEGVHHEIGTSGFLYRSNKLMYDKATQSLWNTMQGIPVVGPLVDKGIKLEHLSVVTTTWGEWKKRHPNTKVLSLETGYQRDYSEGVAYKSYFATNRLMFNTPFNDQRLSNKAEVLALRFDEVPGKQLAISVEFLAKNPVYQDELSQTKFVVFTDGSGANRVYERGLISFKYFDGNTSVTDESGTTWTLTESKLIAETGEVLERLPYHRAFWFGWLAAFPDTELVK